MSKAIYILLSKTPTRFGKVIRKIGNQQYNHASLILDDNLEHIYAFARTCHAAPLLGGLVRENLDRFTLRQSHDVPVTIFRIPVTDEQHDEISSWVSNMLNNKKYVYNLFSVITYPVFKGFTVKNAFSCIEFVTYVLQYLGFCKDKIACKYKPDDLLISLKEYIYAQDDVRKYITYNDNANAYFVPFQMRIIPKSIASVCRIIKHSFSLSPLLSNLQTFHIN